MKPIAIMQSNRIIGKVLIVCLNITKLLFKSGGVFLSPLFTNQRNNSIIECDTICITILRITATPRLNLQKRSKPKIIKLKIKITKTSLFQYILFLKIEPFFNKCQYA